MEEIIRGLYLGSDDDVAEAKRRGYARLCCCKNGIDSHRSMLEYEGRSAPDGKDYYFARRGDVMALNLIDVDDPDMIPDKVIDAGLKFIKEMQDKGRILLVHCNAGMSRSVGIMMLYLRSVGELSPPFNKARHFFKHLYHPADMGSGMEYRVRTRWNSQKDLFLK